MSAKPANTSPPRSTSSRRNVPYATPHGESKPNSRTPSAAKSALRAVDGKKCLITRQQDSAIELCHILRRSLRDEQLAFFRDIGILLNIHSRGNLLSLDASLHLSFDRNEWTIVPTEMTLSWMLNYIEDPGEDGMTFEGMWSSSHIANSSQWQTYEFASFPTFKRCFALLVEEPAEHLFVVPRISYALYLPSEGPSPFLQTNYRVHPYNSDVRPYPMKPFKHHGHPLLILMAAAMRYAHNKLNLTGSQQQRLDNMVKVLKEWLKKKAVDAPPEKLPQEDQGSNPDDDGPDKKDEVPPPPDPLVAALAQINTLTGYKGKSAPAEKRPAPGESGDEPPSKKRVSSNDLVSGVEPPSDIVAAPDPLPDTDAIVEMLLSMGDLSAERRSSRVESTFDGSEFSVEEDPGSLSDGDESPPSPPSSRNPAAIRSASTKLVAVPACVSPDRVLSWVESSSGAMDPIAESF
ncbi:hypothetical protein DACRYDRAFT_117389 [Dacryopinax primogenitus]|uniref:HNH nuclease domain-containing protein n=1 Tax=Dacryopinax primogenitus (strain DJM 731) TaxID=1858805 RepID=M5FVQ3_DACPD|nr:uncharacterized protein DACRYDRAFT_117389 [Dacryopinax primogenitus]EJU00419.1 hypothetical protein DACRYDRAFT_117389 [Dacryopinax primogenitus]